MAEKTKIPWCDHTFNPWWGCTKVSSACDNCYAEVWAKRTGHDVFGADKPRRFFGDKHWNEPIAWDATAAAAGERRRVFCGSMCDVFESDAIEPSGADERDYARDALWHLIEGTPRLDWLLLTKRPQYIEAMVPSEWYHPDWFAENCRHMSTSEIEIVPDRPLGWPLNLWIGTTVENQDTLARCDWLLRCRASVRFLSCEPLLGRLRFANFDGIHWLIIGCESGPRRRHVALAAVRDLVAQGRAAGVKVFVKQLEIDGRVSADPADWPEDLHVQEFPR